MSALRAGDWVEVRPMAEVMATLDGQGALAGLPFMPEMAKYCGRRFQVFKSAHKTCDPTGLTNMRRMEDAVHLETRCDGSAHDGCEARCLLYWKTAWLKPVDGPGAAGIEDGDEPAPDIQALAIATRDAADGEVRYRCQATEIVRATTILSSKDPKQYAQDIASKNISIPHFARHFGAALAQSVTSRLGRLASRFGGGAQDRPTPPRAPSASLGLKPGDLVQIRSAKEIEATLDKNGKNRGLALEREMLRYSGRICRVAYRVGQIIDETTGRKIKLESDCIVLEGLTCAGLENRGRLFCPRSSFFYWREAWLKPVT
ncbi:MAG: hypothetical protein JOZ72_07560 [Alphaproteobacteria bacterium]|nr:hypothetical protein [Alphaproteobacteria bacterium]